MDGKHIMDQTNNPDKTNVRSRKPSANAGWKLRTLATVGAVAAGGCIFYASSIAGSGLPSGLGFWTTVAHFVEYSALGACLAVALGDGRRNMVAVIVIAIMICSIYGASDELHQWFVPGRSTDVLDWITDTVGGAAGSLIASAIAAKSGSRRR